MYLYSLLVVIVPFVVLASFICRILYGNPTTMEHAVDRLQRDGVRSDSSPQQAALVVWSLGLEFRRLHGVLSQGHTPLLGLH